MISVLRLTAVYLLGLTLAFSAAQFLCAQEKNTDDRPAKPKKESPKKGQSTDLEGDRFITREPSPVRYSASYCYGNADRETTPVLVLHDEKGSRKDFLPLTDLLANNGFAVLAPDLRGHGRSNKRYEKTELPGNNPNGKVPQRLPARTTPKLVDYLAEDFQSKDYQMMFTADLPLMRSMLERVHVAGEANLNRLVIVGAGRSCALAAYQAAQDWSGKDSGKFTKTLVLIAPAMNETQKTPAFAALVNNKLVKDDIAVFFAVPENSTLSGEFAEKMRTAFIEKSKDEKAAARFPLITYPATKKMKDDKGGETTADIPLAEVLAGGKLAQSIFNFINQRNQTFGDKENRWTKLK
ncbi:MAG: hypothetical protein LBN39_04875 [Planctomycetaceae bacterium]|jgi:pimeloyl-ACP methyl ester carboxylesterase|nr:hypothetical protein [Planctomycetaceae bacterium]